jgi:uncharacterized repeat protein (TIGR01451 family)
MKLRNLFNSVKNLPKKVLVTAAVAAAALPIAGIATANTQVVMEGDVKALNVTKGQTQYQDSTDAMVDEVVQVQLWQHNRELPGAAEATNNRVKFTIPTAQGKTQVLTGTASADNANTITDTTTVNLSMDRARVEFIPGSAQFRYNKGAVDGRAECISGMNYPPADCYATVAISDDVVTNPNGANLDAIRKTHLKGCNAYHETITIQVRSVADVVSVNKYVRHAGQGASDWKTSTTAKPGDDLEYKIRFKNEGNTTLNKVVVGDNLPNYNKYVAGSTKLYSGSHPDGLAISSDNISKGGIDVGNFMSGAEAYVIIKVKLDPITAYPRCATYDMRNVGVVQPQGMQQYYNTAQVLIKVECQDQKNPTFSCDVLKADKTGGRTVRYTVNASAANGATIQRYVYNFGDGSQPLITTANTATHTYGTDGNFVTRVQVQFTVNNELKTAEGDQCSAPINFASTPTTPTTSGKLPETGAGSVAAIFGGVTAFSTLAYHVVMRRFGRN